MFSGLGFWLDWFDDARMFLEFPVDSCLRVLFIGWLLEFRGVRGLIGLVLLWCLCFVAVAVWVWVWVYVFDCACLVDCCVFIWCGLSVMVCGLVAFWVVAGLVCMIYGCVVYCYGLSALGFVLWIRFVDLVFWVSVCC